MEREQKENILLRLRLETRWDGYPFHTHGDIKPLQLEMVRFLRPTLDEAYDVAVNMYNSGRLKVRLSRGEAIGNEMDGNVRNRLSALLNRFHIPYGRSGNININNRNPDTSRSPNSYRIPDARFGDIAFEWTLLPKTESYPQIRGFFEADSQPRGVVILRPSQLGGSSIYYIERPAHIPFRRSIMTFEPYDNNSVGAIIDLLCMMMLTSPRFEDKTGYFPDQNIDTTFEDLNGRLAARRSKLGEERYLQLREMSDRMRAHFEADPEDKTGDTIKGQEIIEEMKDLLRQKKQKPSL